MKAKVLKQLRAMAAVSVRRCSTATASTGRCAIIAALAGVQFAAPAMAAPSAATICPPFSFVNATNLAANPSFETIGANGNPSICPAPCVAPKESAAARWFIHSDNFGSAVSTRVEPISVLNPNPVPFGTDPARLNSMLHVIAGGNEGGVFQRLRSAPARMMFQVWVYVKRGKVVIQPHGSNVGPAAFSTKTNQWEQLRVCTDGTVPTNLLVIYNQIATGGNFYVDRAEYREIPAP